MISLSLIGNPNLEDPKEPKRKRILEMCEKVASFDPQFILKVSNLFKFWTNGLIPGMQWVLNIEMCFLADVFMHHLLCIVEAKTL